MFQREIRDFSTVPRWTTLRTIRQQNIAEHSFYVMVYTRQIINYLDMQLLMLVALEYAMYHDGEETFSGDTPGPWKRLSEDATKASVAARRLMAKRFPEWDDGPVHDIVKWVVKLANLVDEIAFLGNEFQMGNRNVTGVAANTMERTQMHLASPPNGVTKEQCDGLWNEIQDASRRHMYDLSDYLTG